MQQPIASPHVWIVPYSEDALRSGLPRAGSLCPLIELRNVDSIGEGAGNGRRAAQDEQDAIASQILASLAGEHAWKARFAEKRDVIRRMAREALEEDDRGETLPPDDLL